MMVLIILVIFISIFAINLFSSKKDVIQNVGGSFLLKDHEGSYFNSKSIKKKKLIYFGYTYCPDICPMDVLKISQVYDLNNDLKNELLPIFITVDPERDAFIGLTGTTKEIDEVIKNFKIYVNYNKKNKNDNTYLVDHSSLIFIIDEDDNFLALLRPNEVNIDNINKYLKEII